ncbi:MAG: hypothetical protein ACRDRL_18755, partial [Sciscionella sp.]
MHSRLIGFLGVLGVVLVALSGCSSSPSPVTSHSPHPVSAPPVSAITTLGADGVRAGWVSAENRRPGTAGWRIHGRPPGVMAGFADHVDASAGQRVRLFVSTTARHFRVEAYRMGYYGG